MRRLCGALLAHLAGAALTVAAAAGGSGCATSSNAGRRADARLVVVSNVADARVYVDDAFVGRAADLRGHAILVAAGTRRLELRADGWFPAYRDVAVPHAGRAEVSVELKPVPANEPAE
jgi:hypothetical protein